MRHRRKGRILGRNPSHQRALLKSLACALFLTERDAEFDDNKPKTKGRIITTITKATKTRFHNDFVFFEIFVSSWFRSDA